MTQRNFVEDWPSHVLENLISANRAGVKTSVWRRMAIPRSQGQWMLFWEHTNCMCFFPTSQLQDLVVSSLLVFAPHNWFLSCSLQVFIPNIEIETCFFQLWRGSSLYLFSINCTQRERERLTWLTKVATGIRPCSTSHKWLWRFFRNRFLDVWICLCTNTHQTHINIFFTGSKCSDEKKSSLVAKDLASSARVEDV